MKILSKVLKITLLKFLIRFPICWLSANKLVDKELPSSMINNYGNEVYQRLLRLYFRLQEASTIDSCITHFFNHFSSAILLSIRHITLHYSHIKITLFA